MSHYAVAVFSDDGNFDRLLAPYDENNKKEFEFVPVDYQQIVDDFERFKKHNPKWTLKMYIENYHYFQKDGVWGYEHNPHGYWDWYSLDGRDYLFDVRDDVIENPESDEWFGYYRKSDYDWYPQCDPREQKDNAKFWDEFVIGGKEDGYPSLWNRDYYLERYRTKEQFLKEMERTIPYAFITPDGVWHSAGRVGWFATSNETAEDADRYAKEWDEWIASDANPYVSLVDCHI